MQLDDFTRGYIEAALWVNDPAPGQGEYQANLDDAPEDYVRQAAVDCESFQRYMRGDLSLAGSDAQNGHDFYLTRNGHGAGFWDRGYGDVGDVLTTAAHGFGESDDAELFEQEEG